MKSLIQAIWLLVLMIAPAVRAAGRPNVVLVTIDTIRADRVGCYGYAKAETPALDRLAREGIRFENAFSPVPLTLPAHASILTGTYPTYHGVRDNAGYTLTKEHMTLARLFKSSGYSTAAFVGAYVLDSKFGLNQSFDYYFDDFDLDQYQNVSPGYIRHRGNIVVGEALRWLAKHSNQPFFIWVHLYDAHDPYFSPPPFAQRHTGQPYDGALAFADANLGTLLAWLKNNGVYDNSLVVAVGDHGESLGEHGDKTHGLFLYDSVLHVPLIIHMPASKSAGSTIAENVTTIDLAPTIATVAGLPEKQWPKFQGRSLLHLVSRQEESARQIYAESYYSRLQFGWSELRAIIAGHDKYILAPKPELYDTSSDPSETVNTAAQKTALASQLRGNLATMLSRITGPKMQLDAKPAANAENARRLQALGYIGNSMGNAGAKSFLSLPDPKDEVTTYNQLLDLAEGNSRGDYESTIPGYQSILEGQSDFPLAHYKLGQAYFHVGNYAAALEQFKIVLAQGQDAAGPTFELAMTYEKLGQNEDAITGFRRTIKADPANYEAHINLGVLLTGLNRIPEAIDELQKAAGLAPRSTAALSSLGVAYSLHGENDRAVESLQRALVLSPRDAFLHANLGAVYQRMGRSADAAREFSLARQLKPGFFNN